MRVCLGLLVAVGACITSQSVPCEDGRVCPSGTTCEETHHLCIVPDQATACGGLAENAACTFGSSIGACHDGICLEAVCGDGVVEGTEQCEVDDLQGVTGCLDLGYYQDGPVTCDVDCRFDRSQCAGICGDGVVDPAHEACDATHDIVVAQCNDPTVGFYNPGDVHCNAACELDTSACTGSCGDGIVNGSEACDGVPPALGCLGYGYDYGTIGCVRCGPSFSQCGRLGWRDEEISLLNARSMMGTSPTDVWVSTLGAAYHTVDHVTRPFALAPNEGVALWVHGNELFLSGTNQIEHGIVATNGDVTFTSQTLPVAAAVTHLSGTDTTSLYASAFVIATGAIEIFHYNGSAWTLAMAGPSSAPVVAFWAQGANDVWLATNNLGTGVLWHWTGTWSVVIPPTTLTVSSVINAVWAADATHVFFGGSLGVAEWNGATWTVMAVGLPIFAISGVSATDVVAAGFETYRFDGSFWNDFSTPDGAYTLALWDGGSVVCEAVQSNSGIRLSFNEGSVWEGNQLASESATAVWDGDGTAVLGTQDAIYQRDATGAWIDVLDGIDVVSVWGFAANDYWMTDSNVVEHYDGTWHDMTNNLTTVGNTGLLRIWGSSSSDLWGVDAHTFFHWNGATWSSTPSGHTLTAIHGTGPGDVWASTADGVILHYNGASWSAMALPTTQTIEDVWAIDTTHVYVVGDHGTIASWNGSTWALGPTTTTAFSLNHVWGLTPTDVFALSGAGELFHYDGTGWGLVRPTTLDESNALGGDATHVYLLGGDGVVTLYRARPWL